MDFVNKLAGGGNDNKAASEHQQQNQQAGSSSFMDKLHGMAGGGPESEKKEGALDKGIDWVQENVLKQGPQDNESAAEQAKDRFIAEQIRQQYKKATGKDMPFGEAEKQAQEEKKAGFPNFGGLLGGK
ncbi:hypothetical protein N657DRAFT_271218 [Parathielavia appendiculata]|uniref:Uncharacterized protein n=1 Tax=Parathielavia appendiculata TaxID=2587402 RepID=A0AAN6Z637_9PEZI|nr:hypothetical protein N657DRAFT_271218 [Parathielavia appendiculata]